MRVGKCAAGLLAVWLLLESGVAWAGDLTGTVTIKSKVPPRAVGRKRVRISDRYGPKAAEDSVVPSDLDETSFVVIQVEGPGLKVTPRKFELTQKNKQFLPHVLAIPKGSKVRFLNEDDFEHNVYSVSDPGSFDTGKYQGKFKEITFDEPNALELFCGIHPRMNAYIVVTPNDFYAMPDAGHNYKISGLPAGNYTVKCWHPRLPAKETKIQVPATGAVDLDFEL